MNILERIQQLDNIPANNFITNHNQEIHHCVEQVLHEELHLKNCPDDQLIPVLHEGIEMMQKEIDWDNKIQCTKQECSFCCHSEIFVHQLEVDYIKKHGTYEIDRERLEKQRTTSYRKLSFKDRACIMLKDGKCQVYKYRPMLCRTHSITAGQDPALCEQQALSNDGSVVIEQPHTIMTTAIQIYPMVKRGDVLDTMKNIADFDW